MKLPQQNQVLNGQSMLLLFKKESDTIPLEPKWFFVFQVHPLFFWWLFFVCFFFLQFGVEILNNCFFHTDGVIFQLLEIHQMMWEMIS